MGNTSFCWVFLTIANFFLGVGFSFSKLNISEVPLSSIFFWFSLAMLVLSSITYTLQYIFLFKITLFNKESGKVKVVRHSSYHSLDKIFDGWIPHSTTGAAVTGFDSYKDEDLECFYFEGQEISKESFLAIQQAQAKGELNNFLISNNPVERDFANHRMKTWA